MDRERSERLGLENQLRERVRETIEIQAKYDAMNAELTAK